MSHRRRELQIAVAVATALLASIIAAPGTRMQVAAAPLIDLAWQRDIPTSSGTAAIQAVTVLGGDVIVAGQVSGEVPGGTSAGSADVWVARYTGQGDLVWITQFGTDSVDTVSSVAASAAGIVVGGWTLGHFEDAPFDTQRDFVAGLSSGGTFEWAHESEQSSGSTGAHVGIGPGGDAIVAWTDHASGPSGSGFVGSIRRYRPDGVLRWERRMTACCGSTQSLVDVALIGIAADVGGLTVTGRSGGSVDSAMPDAMGGFVRRFGYDGATRWTSFIGVSPTWGPEASGIEASEAGIWVSGTSAHPITGDPDRWPDLNPFLRRSADSGAVLWTKAIPATHTAPDCASILVTGDIPAAADPAHGPGAYVARIDPDGTTDWRFESIPEPEHLVSFVGVARGPEQVFVAIERENGQYSIAALGGVHVRANCDTTPPAVSAPAARFSVGTRLTSSIPLRLTWTASDAGSGLAAYDVIDTVDRGVWRYFSERQLPAWTDAAVLPGHQYQFGVRAYDRAGRTKVTLGPSLRVVRREDGSVRVAYRGSWRTIADPGASGGATHASSAAGASATFTFSGRAVAWIAPVSSVRGAARVYVDGHAAGIVNLQASTAASRRVVFARSWATAGTHTVRIVAVGTANHPRVDVDAFVTLE